MYHYKMNGTLYKLSPSVYYSKINSHICSIEYNYNWNITGYDSNSILYYIKSINRNKYVINKFSDVLFSCYVNLLKHFDKNTMWQNFYAIKLSCKSLSKTISPIIDFALSYVVKYKIDILPPNILSFIYPSITFSTDTNKIIVPKIKDIYNYYKKNEF